MNRREYVSGMTGMTAVLLSGCNSLSPAGIAEASTSVDDSVLEVTTSDGVIDEVIMYVEVAFEYSGWHDDEITHIGFESEIDGETIKRRDFGLNHPDWMWDGERGDGESGSGTYRVFMSRTGDHDRIFLFEDAPNYEQSDLEIGEPGETETFELDFDIGMRLIADDDDVVWTSSDSATIEIIHTYRSDDTDGEASMTTTVDVWAEVDGEYVGPS